MPAIESPALPAEDRSYAPPTPRAPAATEWRDVTALLAAANELGAYEDTAAMLRRAVELVRERLGLERVSFYLRDPSLERIVTACIGSFRARRRATTFCAAQPQPKWNADSGSPNIWPW